MASILTNTSSMVALQTLKGINKGMAKVQDEISTGFKISTAKDNGAVWAIAQTMRSDIAVLGKVQEALSLGSSTVGTARVAAESISDMLTEAKKYVVNAGDLSNDDTRAKLLDDLHALGNLINTTVNTASYNGVNLVGTTAAAAGDPPTAPAGAIDVTAAVTRADDGTHGVQNITINEQDLSGVGTVLTDLDDADLQDIATTLTTIEAELTKANEAAAAFGTSQKQIELQSAFVSKFIDSLKSGVGAMVDADMEEASARLAALQTQQQLGIQALSIANQMPQNVLSLFR
jgi:flagellin